MAVTLTEAFKSETNPLRRGVIAGMMHNAGIIDTRTARDMILESVDDAEYEKDLVAWRADMADEQTQAGPPKMGLGDATQDYGEFLGIITVDEWIQGKEGGWQWHICVKPTDFDVQGQTQAFHTWYKYSDRKNSKMGIAHEAMLGLPELFPKGTELGQGNLVGKAAWWTRQDIEFGKDKNTGEVFKAEGVLIPVRTATDEETKRAVAKMNGQSSAAAPVEAASATEIDDADLEAAVKLIDGKSRAQIQMAVARDKALPKEVKAALLSGELVTQLAEAGLVSLDDEGVAHAAVAA